CFATGAPPLLRGDPAPILQVGQLLPRRPSDSGVLGREPAPEGLGASVANGKDTSFMRSLCMGNIEEDMIVPFPTTTAEERETLRSVVSSLGDLFGPHEQDFPKWDRKAEMPASYIEELKAAGLFGLIIPKKHGRLG